MECGEVRWPEFRDLWNWLRELLNWSQEGGGGANWWPVGWLVGNL